MRVVSHQGLRSPDPLIKSQMHGIRKPLGDKDLQPAEESRAAHLQRAENRSKNTPETCPEPSRTGLPPELAETVAAWPHLPEPVKTGIHAMVRAVTATPGRLE